MKIARIELWRVTVPLAAPFHPSWIPGMAQTENRFTLVRLCTADGVEGWAAAPEMAKERSGLGSMIGPYLLGERADDLESIRQRIREMGYLGYRCGWIEPAAWDIVGKARGKPVYELLGGRGGTVKLYASTGEVRSGSERVEEVSRRLEEGFEAVKLRVHDDHLEQDLAQLRETRQGVGDAPVLGVDANQAWRVAAIADCARWDYERAYAFCKEAEQLGFDWVEEPLPMDGYDDLARLTAATDIKIAGGELNNQGLPELKMMIERRCYDWFQPDAVMVGGIAETWAIMRHAHAHGLKYSPHTWTNGVGFGINLQLFAASSRREDSYLEYPYDPPGWVPEGRDGVLARPWLHEKGTLEIPTAPGLGFDIDLAALKRHGRRFYVATNARVAVAAVRDRGLRNARRLGATRAARLDTRSAELDRRIAAGEDPVASALEALDVPRA